MVWQALTCHTKQHIFDYIHVIQLKTIPDIVGPDWVQCGCWLSPRGTTSISSPPVTLTARWQTSASTRARSAWSSTWPLNEVWPRPTIPSWSSCTRSTTRWVHLTPYNRQPSILTNWLIHYRRVISWPFLRFPATSLELKSLDPAVKSRNLLRDTGWNSICSRKLMWMGLKLIHCGSI